MTESAISAQGHAKPSRRERLRALLPEVWGIVRPRRWLLLAGMILIALGRLASMAPPLATKFLIDNVIARHQAELLPKLALALAGAALFQALTSYALQQLFSRSTSRLIGELRCQLEMHVLRLPLLYHDTNKSGALGSRIMNDVQGLQNLVGTGLLSFVGSLMTSVIAVALMARANLMLTVVALGSLGTLGALIAVRTRKLRDIAVERSKINADVVGRLTEALGGVRVVKAYRAEGREDSIFASGIARMVENVLRTVNLSSSLGFATAILWGTMSVVVMWIGGLKVLSGELTLGSFFTFTVLLAYAVAPLQQLVAVGGTLMEALAGLERTRELLREPTEDRDPARIADAGAIQGLVVFDRVSFSYAPSKPVLVDFSFRAEPGTVTALVGPSGSGKSTTIGLIASFYKPNEGTILVDGNDLATLRLDGYRSQLGVVLQETFLFAGTILENVAFARPSASRQEILAACRTARVDEFAEKLGEGYETVVGERGVLLSGGQRQRISIARALLADPRILILDEATSSLDTHSETLIQEALSHLLAGRTTFVIAHRLSTIRKADQILVVDEGRIVERGTHEELLARRAMYFEMYSRQHQVDADLLLAPGEGAEPVAGPRPRLRIDAEEPAELDLPLSGLL